MAEILEERLDIDGYHARVRLRDGRIRSWQRPARPPDPQVWVDDLEVTQKILETEAWQS